LPGGKTKAAQSGLQTITMRKSGARSDAMMRSRFHKTMRCPLIGARIHVTRVVRTSSGKTVEARHSH